jgi:hypothetical protein
MADIKESPILDIKAAVVDKSPILDIETPAVGIGATIVDKSPILDIETPTVDVGIQKIDKSPIEDDLTESPDYDDSKQEELKNEKKEDYKNEKKLEFAHRFIGVLDMMGRGYEVYTNPKIMQKSAPWFSDIQSYPATPEDSIKRFEIYHPKFNGIDCQMTRSNMGFWCAIVHLPNTHKLFKKETSEFKIKNFERLRKFSDGVFGFSCDSDIDLVPVRDYKNWRQFKAKKSYKKYLVVKAKLEELCSCFADYK